MPKDKDKDKTESPKKKQTTKDTKERDDKKKKTKKEKQIDDENDNSLPSKDNINKEPIDTINNINPIYDKCDGCFGANGEKYCIDCELVLCKACEDQIHILPSNQVHERFELGLLKHIKKKCYHHKKSLQSYCESCDEPICEDCIVQGPHNNKLHKTTNIITSFKKKYEILLKLMNVQLKNKLEKLENQLQVIENIINEVKTNKSIISKTVQEEYSYYLNRLKEQEGKKLSLIQYNYNEIICDLEVMDDIFQLIEACNHNNSNDEVDFLLKYKQIKESVDGIVNKKPLEYSQLEVSASDFEKFIEENHKKLEKYEKIKELLKEKDNLIWELINEKRNKVISDEYLHKRKELMKEVEEWGHLSYKYLKELKKFNKVCFYCGVKLDNKVINSTCMKNTADYMKSTGNKAINMNYCDIPEKDTSECYLSGSHYWGVPSKDYEEKVNMTINKNRIIQKGKEKIIETDVLFVFEKMRKTSKSKGIDIEKEVIANYGRNGFVDRHEFMRFLKEKYLLTDDEAEVVSVKIMKKPDFQFENEEKEMEEGRLKIKEVISFVDQMKKITSPQKEEGERVFSSSSLKGSIMMSTDYNPNSDWYYKIVNGNENEIKEVLSLYDSNHDGYVSPLELKEALIGMNLKLNENDIKNMFIKMNYSDEKRKIFINSFLDDIKKERDI